jgi:hypothetical protein
MQRTIGRLLISLATLATAVIPSPVMGICHTSSVRNGPPMRAFMALCLLGCRSCSPPSCSGSYGAAQLNRRPQPPWPLSSPSPDFGPFFATLVIPGAGLVDPGQRLKRIAGVPSPLFSAAATIPTAAVGWYLARSGSTRPAPAHKERNHPSHFWASKLLNTLPEVAA